LSGEVSWLVADVGGTHTRFACAGWKGPEIRLERRTEFHTADFDSFDEALGAYVVHAHEPGVSGACIAVAGPVDDGEAILTNGGWRVSVADVGARLGVEHALVINDFHAVARGLTQLSGEDLEPVGAAGVSRPGASKVVLGPGTGLGVAALLPEGGQWRVVPTEWGHAPLAPTDFLELEVLKALLQRHRFVTWEHVLSGPGLENLYHVVNDLWGAEGAELSAPEITRRAVAHDPVCHQTLELFCSILGTAAGSVATTFCAKGGVYLAGGILPQIPEFLAASHFRGRFEAAATMLECPAQVPIFLIIAADVGLLGAATALRAALA
jgi:glucokinase